MKIPIFPPHPNPRMKVGKLIMKIPIFPPHPNPRMKVQPDSVGFLEKEGGWIAQRKYNGTHVVMHLWHSKLQIWNRHGEPLRSYKLTSDMERVFIGGLRVDPEIAIVLDGELLHTKAVSKITGQQSVTNTIVLFDLLYLGKPLLTQDFDNRYNALVQICNNPILLEPKKRGLLVSQVGSSQLWLAQNFYEEFLYHFYEMYEFDKWGRDKYPEIEGLVCKMRNNSLLKFGNLKYDVNWMMRVRKTKEKVYLF